ncbi:tetratricopeptide repeat protein [Hymenobacter latericus]|uniref:tetratricopeptide repeat protein n=1 Tax=Hymenobacter sp. YIM 151858-1 TaxID=2987688 RepID=UPI0022264354|nr:hypothetical protein [Hymenobacter sp. YIM 151858-1]UYZ59236.1 hypothetical protein OIS50_00180 [Hymenobacter sp. YIM 151858-1]
MRELPSVKQDTPRGLLWGLLGVLFAALGLAFYFHFAGPEHTLPVGTVAQLTPVPATVAKLPAGPDTLGLPANAYLVTQTYDVAGPNLWPAAAGAWVVLLSVGLAVWLAAISQLRRPAFVAGAAVVIFLLMSLNMDLLGVFGEQDQYFLVLSIAVLIGAAFVLHAFFEGVSPGRRLALFALLIAALGALLFAKTRHPASFVVLHLAAYGTLAGAAAVALLAVWLGGELIYGLLWLNTQGATAKGRFGLIPFVLSSALLLGILLMYYWNGGQLAILPGVRLNPYLLLLLAAVVGWYTLPLREPTYRAWLPRQAATWLYVALLLVAAGTFGYASATLNEPLLQATRDFIALAFGAIGLAFFGYVLLNFGQLIQQRLQVHRVAYDPRRMPFYVMYVLGIGLVAVVLMRNQFDLLDRASAGQYIQFGDLTRLQSEQRPDNLYLALLAERYYAEADQMDPLNARAALGRAALYQARAQRQNEINILRSTLRREPNEKVWLRLAARFDQPTDFFERQQVLRQGLGAFPASGRLNAEMAQLYSRSFLPDSVLHYYGRATAANAADPVPHTNWLAFLLKNNQLAGAQAAATETPNPNWPAWQNNTMVLDLLRGRYQPVAASKPAIDSVLTVAQFAQLYHLGLAEAARHDTTALPLVQNLLQVQANDPFADQLTFVSGLQLLRSARPAPGFDRLEALATGVTSGYYHQVLGMYLLERGLYPSAAARLALAEQAGNAAALAPRAYALAWAGQPDSARAVALRAIIAAPTSAGRLRSLAAGTIPPAPRARRPSAQAYANAAATASKDAKAAARQYQKLTQADPFDEKGVLQASEFFAARQDPVTAYEIMRRAVSYNPESVAMLQGYVLAATDAGLEEYASASFAKLATLLPSSEYITFRKLYDKRRAAHRAAVAPWN